MAVYRASEIQTFTNTEFGSVRVVDINGEPWFVGKDVADVLGYVDAKQAVRDHVFENDKLGVELTTNFGKKKTWCINEYGIYQLVISSQLPTARKFQYWVTHEVLPSIRKYGAYMTPQTLEAAILNPDTLIKVCLQLKAEQEKNRELEAIRDPNTKTVFELGQPRSKRTMETTTPIQGTGTDRHKGSLTVNKSFIVKGGTSMNTLWKPSFHDTAYLSRCPKTRIPGKVVYGKAGTPKAGIREMGAYSNT